MIDRHLALAIIDDSRRIILDDDHPALGCTKLDFLPILIDLLHSACDFIRSGRCRASPHGFRVGGLLPRRSKSRRLTSAGIIDRTPW